MLKLQILYHDEFLIAVNKPNNLLVHRTNIAADADEFALQILRNQIQRQVFPVHRLDRKTSGVLLFALNTEINTILQRQFAENKVDKQYLAIVRGFTDKTGSIDYPLKKENGNFQQAITNYRTIAQSEVAIPLGNHSSARYSLVEIIPKTGRMHQIRKHFAHILHPIIGDRPHGCNKQNKLFKEKWNMTNMLLHASKMGFEHPISGNKVWIHAPVNEEFMRVLKILNLKFDQPCSS